MQDNSAAGPSGSQGDPPTASGSKQRSTARNIWTKPEDDLLESIIAPFAEKPITYEIWEVILTRMKGDAQVLGIGNRDNYTTGNLQRRWFEIRKKRREAATASGSAQTRTARNFWT